MSFSERLDAVIEKAPHETKVTSNTDSNIATIEVDGAIGTKLLLALSRNDFKPVYINDGKDLKFQVRILDKA